MRRGSVIGFDEAAGLGTVRADADGRRYRFHLVEIADGSRTIEVGQTVLFGELSRFGEVQAGSIHKI